VQSYSPLCRFIGFKQGMDVDFSASLFSTGAHFISDHIASLNCAICLTIQCVFIESVLTSDLALGRTLWGVAVMIILGNVLVNSCV
jgi:hypothetical protein